MNMKLKWGKAGRLRRGSVVLGVVGLAAGAAVFTAGSALAANGSQPGNLTLSPASGALTLQPTWSTSTGCPVGNQGSAVIEEFNMAGTPASRVSNVVAAPAAPITNATLLGNMSGLLGSSDIVPGGTVEWAVACFTCAGGTGTSVYVQSTFVTEDAAGANYSTSPNPPVKENTTTTLIATPNPAPTGTNNVTLTASVAGVAGSSVAFPAGTVQFQNCPTPSTCSNINAAVAVNTGNVSASAVTTTGFATAGSENLQAVFTPTSAVTINGSTGTFILAVGSSLAGGTNPVNINVTVQASGSLSVTVAAGSVTLAPQATTPDETATGTFNTVTIADSRNTFPGWSVSGQESVFTGPGTNTIPANSLGWTPAFVGAAAGGAIIGAPVAPVGANAGSTGPGLGSPAVLVQAHSPNGFGTNTVNAGLLLDIPSSTPPGAYAGTLTVTYVSAN
jgi:hypothetical protein